MPVILDAKRGDIGATAEQYAREAFERYGADAVTLSPFMGFDSIEPYLRHAGKGAAPAVPHLQPRRRRPAGPAARDVGGEPLSTSTSPRLAARALEPQRPARPGRRRHLSGRDRARARAGADAAAADPRHRRAGRRCGGDGARRLARRGRTGRSSSARRARSSTPAAATTSPRPHAVPRWPPGRNSRRHAFSWLVRALARRRRPRAAGGHYHRRHPPGLSRGARADQKDVSRHRMAISPFRSNRPDAPASALVGVALSCAVGACAAASATATVLLLLPRPWTLGERIELTLVLVAFAALGGWILGRSLRRRRLELEEERELRCAHAARHRRRPVSGSRTGNSASPTSPRRATRSRTPVLQDQLGRTPWQIAEHRPDRGAARRAPRRPRGAPPVRRPAAPGAATPKGAAHRQHQRRAALRRRRRVHRLLGRRPRRHRGDPRAARDDGQRDALPRAVRALAVAAAAASATASCSTPTPPRRACSASPSPAAMTGLPAGRPVPAGDNRQLAAERIAQLESMPVGEGAAGHRLRGLRRDGRADHRPGDRRPRRHRDRAGDAVDHCSTSPRASAVEAALRRSEAMLSHLFATSPDCIALSELDSGRHAMVNAAFTRVTGYALERGRRPDRRPRSACGTT